MGELNPHQPPKWINRVLDWYCKQEYANEIRGDLMELYQRWLEKGKFKADIKYVLNAIMFMRLYNMKTRSDHNLRPTGMFKNRFKIAFRVFKKEKSYSLINISGLALGFICCLLITLFIRDELSYDRFHQDAERIYRVSSAYMRQGVWEPYSSNSWPTAERLKTNFGQIEQLVRIRPRELLVAYGEKKFNEDRMATVDENFFQLFTFPLISGNPQQALKGSNKVVISKSTAQKYFGDTNPMGKVLEIIDGDYQLQVSGIMEDMPSNTHFHFDFLISGATARQVMPEQMFTNVGWDSQYVYIKLEPAASPWEMEAAFPDFIDNHLSPFTSGNFKLFLQPLLDIHLHSNNGLEIEPNGKIAHVYIFSVIAVFILVIACVNYMNLTTARSTRRAKEVGLRKVLGSSKASLISQFLTESFIMTFVAGFIAVGLTILLLPEFNQFAGKDISRAVLLDPVILTAILAILLITALLSGAYPSFVLSAFKPLNTLKGGKVNERLGLSLRRGLVVLQFVISIGLIAATSIVFKQLSFLKNKDLGINKEMLVAVPLQTMDRAALDAFNNELMTHSSIIRTASSNMKTPGWISNSTRYRAQDVPIEEDARKSMKIIRINHDFFKTMEAEIVEGRDFSRAHPADMETGLILNEAAVAQLGWDHAIGKWMEVEWEGQRYQVIGVVKDFHFESLHRKIPPTIFILSATNLHWDYIKIDANDVAATLAHIESVYTKFVTDRDFTYSFVDEDVTQQYLADEKFTEVFAAFTMLAIALACLGTFGLVSFSAERKSGEIGIRKVLGASVGDVTFLLIKEFITLLLVASLIAWPLTYFFMNDWIQDFVYRTSIGAEAFAIATILALLVAIGTTGFRALKAALVNPVESLRDGVR